DLISSNYTETHYTANGTMVTVAMQDQVDSSFFVCVSVRGFFRTENHDYVIEPLSDSQTGEHVIYRAELLKARDVHCGVTKTMDSALPKFTRRGHPQHRVSGASAPCWKLVILVDADVKDVLFPSLHRTPPPSPSPQIYLPLNTFIALVGLEVWSDRDKISVGPPAEQTLSAFTDWRNNELNKIKQSDHAQVVHFGGLVGLAYIGSLCSTDSTILDTSSSTMETAVVLAHELGHNLGMSHDSPTCFCTKHHCIMGATLSSCSVAEFEEFLRSAASLQCLSNNPNNTTITPPVCGNGFLEEGEDCDCSMVEVRSTPTPGKCKCCKNCKFLPLVVMCRPVRSECDLPEYCTGMSSECPEDTFRANGAPCSNNTGYCHGGQCPRRLDQCTGTWGQTAQTASDSCYELNTHGTQYAYCTRDVACGKLFCWNGSAEPRHGTAVMIGSCKATVHGDPSADYGQVHTGTKCGEGLVRHSRAIHRLNIHGACQCAAGWAPPDCASPHTDYIATAAGESCYLTDGCTCVSECHTLPKKL
uniref:ADAM metallopeptidase domain 28 n=1 Tax=Electrophorus electricus TaxID=8005 RepID=A0A4W4EZF9_ELEEL